MAITAKKADKLTAAHDGEGDALSALQILSKSIEKAFAGQLETRHGITVSEWRVMLTLHRYPGLTAADITSRWAMDKMAISRALQRLEDDGNIRRERNPDDRRSFRLFLSDTGETKCDFILPDATERYQLLMSCLSREEQSALRSTLAKLMDQVERLQG